MKKIVKISVLTFLSLLLILFLSGAGYLISNLAKYSTIPLNTSALTTSNLTIPIYDIDNNLIEEINSSSNNYIKLKEMPPFTYQAFISIEDKDFYRHNGLNYKRILKAALTNIKNKSFSQGASTISQQLIKNTHLSSEKTITRKLKEMVLTKKLEKALTKEEILEAYLNVIYFGNNCYGISSASNYYFSKKPQFLTIAESATLAGIIKSPSKFCPINHHDKCKERRNVVLKEMLKDNKISEKDYQTAKNSDIILSINKNNKSINSYSEACLDEACKILNLPAKQIALSGYKIYSYQNPETQTLLQNSLLQTNITDSDYAGIILDNKTHGISAYIGKSKFKILNSKRQPGSCIKPILCYAPAINEDIISPETQILDEKIKIGEYIPNNINGTFNGYVSVRDAVAKSINIPAVKTLSYIGIEKGKKYAQSMGINFDKKDNSYALALGGMTYGVNLKQLSSAYSTFANKGIYSEAKFISHISTNEGKLVYSHLPVERQVLREDTCYLITDMLKYTATNGTAKKLKELNIEVASKTGTVGQNNSTENSDAWNISYTPSKTICIWAGNLDNSPIKISGGNAPTEVVKNILKNEKNIKFEKPSSIVEREIDCIDLSENHCVKLANSMTPERYKKLSLFSIFNLPDESENFSKKPTIEYKIMQKDNQNSLILLPKNYIRYQIYDDKNNLIKTISETNKNTEIPIPYHKIKIKANYIGSQNTFEKEIFLQKKL